MSKVFLVSDSKVRIPLSHRITFSFPCAMMYSADIGNSFMVAQRPRLRITSYIDVSDLCKEPEILHVAGPDLDDIRILANQHYVSWISRFGFLPSSRSFRALRQGISDPFSPQP